MACSNPVSGTDKLWAFLSWFQRLNWYFRVNRLLVILVSSDSGYKAISLAWFHLRVAIGIFFLFAWNLRHFPHSYVTVTGICHHIFPCSDLFRVHVWQHSFCDHPINCKSKKIFVLYLLHCFVQFSQSYCFIQCITIPVPLRMLLQSCQATWVVWTCNSIGRAIVIFFVSSCVSNWSFKINSG